MNRNSKLFKILGKEIDAAVIFNGEDTFIDQNFRYFVQARSGIFEGSLAIIERDGTTVITNELEATALKGIDVEVRAGGTKKEMEELARKELSRLDTIGLNFRGITLSNYRLLKKNYRGKISNIGVQIARCRAVKDEGEIRNIAAACRIASRVAERIPSLLKEGMSESELAALISAEMYREGGEGNSFSPIVSFGKTSAIPHYSPGNVKLKKGQIVLADFGCKYRHYCSDITRTFIYGRAGERQKQLYETVLEAQNRALAAIKAGAGEKEVDAIARSVIDAGPFRGKFIHSLGHGLGLQVHDGLPFLSPLSKEELQEGMVVTVEPGAYIDGFGGVRIEDDVAVTSEGCRKLTTASRELIEI